MSLPAACKLQKTKIGAASFSSSAGIKQGSPISCTLFTFYLDHTVRAVKSFEEDGYLGDTHLVLLMDDTVILATSREAMSIKLNLLYNSAMELDVRIHPIRYLESS